MKKCTHHAPTPRDTIHSRYASVNTQQSRKHTTTAKILKSAVELPQATPRSPGPVMCMSSCKTNDLTLGLTIRKFSYLQRHVPRQGEASTLE